MKGPQRLRALANRVRRPDVAGGRVPAAEPPDFPTSSLLPPATDLAPAAAPTPRRITDASPFAFADATLHVGDTVVPVNHFELDATWETPKTGPSCTVAGFDGDVIVTGTLAADGTVTIQSTTTVAPPRPPRRTQPPNGCPCTAIYSVCQCPAPK